MNKKTFLLWNLNWNWAGFIHYAKQFEFLGFCCPPTLSRLMYRFIRKTQHRTIVKDLDLGQHGVAWSVTLSWAQSHKRSWQTILLPTECLFVVKRDSPQQRSVPVRPGSWVRHVRLLRCVPSAWLVLVDLYKKLSHCFRFPTLPIGLALVVLPPLRVAAEWQVQCLR